MPLGSLRPRLDAEESSLPTWLSGLLWLGAGVLLIWTSAWRLIRQDFSWESRRGPMGFEGYPVIGNIYFGILLIVGMVVLWRGYSLFREWQAEKVADAVAEQRANRWWIGRKRKP